MYKQKRSKGQLLAALGLAEEYDFEKPIIKKVTKTRPGPNKYSFWTKEQEALLKIQYGKLSRKELARLLGKTIHAISHKAKELGLRRKKEPMWSEEEIDFLDEYWGLHTLPTLARKLNRTETAIIVKAKRLGLGPTKLNTEYMNAMELSGALGVTMQTITDRWIPKYGLKARRKVTFRTFKFWRIKIEDFWAWAEYNQDKFNSLRFEKGSLGEEPGWMQLKRKSDQCIPARRHYKWKPDEDKRLINLFKSGKSYKECGHHLARSDHAVSQRLRRIGWKNVWEVK
jgi:hypothetical protein